MGVVKIPPSRAELAARDSEQMALVDMRKINLEQLQKNIEYYREGWISAVEFAQVLSDVGSIAHDICKRDAEIAGAFGRESTLDSFFMR